MPPVPRRQELATTRRAASVARLTREATNLPAITAAAARVNRRTAGYYRRLLRPWQARALAYYDLVGECHFAAQFYSRALTQVRLFAGEVDDSGEIAETTNEAVIEEVQRIQDPGGGGYSRLMGSYGRLKFLIGEGYFLVTNPTGNEERWEFVSPDELRLTGDGEYLRMLAPSLPAEQLQDVPDNAYKPLGPEALVFRSWRPHPRFSQWPDSSMEAVLDILEELVLLTLAVRGTAKSRLVNNGILAVPDELSPTPLTAGDGGDEDPQKDPFMQDLIEQILAPIQNPGTAAAVSPAIIRGQADHLAELKWIQISNPMETYPEEGLRTEAIRRFATGIEMPAELLTGTADVNHWGAWLIDEQAARNYIFPVCQELVDDLTAVYLRPTLQAANVANWENYVIGYDAAAVVAHPDRFSDAKDAHDRLVISDQTLRNAGDFNDEDAPDQDELERRIATKILDPSALTEPYTVPTTPSVNEDEEQTGEEGGPSGGSEVDASIPATKPDGSEQGFSSLQAATLDACVRAVVRGREKAGAKLRPLTKAADPERFALSITPEEQIGDVPNQLLAHRLGAQWVRQFSSRNEQRLVAGAASELTASLAALGINGDISDTLGRMVEEHAARTLYKDAPPRALPRKFADYVVRSVA